MKVSRGQSIDRYYLFQLFGYGIFIHHIHDSDPIDVFHSHPWNGLRFIFGRYREEHADNPGYKQRKWGLSWLSASRHHRVEVDKPTYSLFFHFRRSNKWSIVDLRTNKTVEEPWRGDEGLKNYKEAVSE